MGGLADLDFCFGVEPGVLEIELLGTNNSFVDSFFFEIVLEGRRVLAVSGWLAERSRGHVHFPAMVLLLAV